MGEAGAEAILPLARGADGRLGVAAGGAAQTAVQVTFNVTTPDAASFAKSEAQVTAMLARAVGRGRRGL
jgi:phage-related minor tail protein